MLASRAPAFEYMSVSGPDAPPLNQTTIGCFIRLFFWMAACIIRAIWSEAPPAPAATTISTGFVGSQAAAGAPASMSASAEPAQSRTSAEPAQRRIRSRIVAIASSLGVELCTPALCALWHDSDARQPHDHGPLHWNFASNRPARRQGSASSG